MASIGESAGGDVGPAGAGPGGEGGAPARVLGPVSATCIVVGAIVGVGIFFSPSRMAALTGSGSLLLLAWGIAGLLAMCGALVFAELGSRYTSNGGQYQVLRDALGPMPGFLFVFCNATAIQAGAIGVIALVCARNLAVTLGVGLSEMWTAGGLIVLLTGANIAGVRWGSRIQNFTVFSKIATLLAVVGLAAVFGTHVVGGSMPPPEAGTAERLAPAAAVMAALVQALFSFGGWQQALWAGGEVRDPARTLPRAIIGGVMLVVIIYLLANWSYLRLLGVANVAASKTLAADAVVAALPGAAGAGRRAIGAAVCVSALGVLNSQLLSGPRLIYGMARDGRFFRVFGQISPRLGTPVWAIALLGAVALGLLLIARENGMDRLLTGAVFIDGVFFILTGVSLMVLRRRESRSGVTPPRAGYRVPLYPFTPVLFIVGMTAVVAGAYMSPDVRSAAVIGAGWIVGAAVVYGIWFRGR